MFYGQRIHDKCYRRPFFDAGQFVEAWDDDGARKGWCLYKMGCRGPTTYNSCSTFKWNNGVSFPIGSGHGCIGCSEDNFWDNGPFYERLSSIPVPGIESTPDTIGDGGGWRGGDRRRRALRLAPRSGARPINAEEAAGEKTPAHGRKVRHGDSSRSRSRHSHRRPSARRSDAR